MNEHQSDARLHEDYLLVGTGIPDSAYGLLQRAFAADYDQGHLMHEDDTRSGARSYLIGRGAIAVFGDFARLTQFGGRMLSAECRRRRRSFLAA